MESIVLALLEDGEWHRPSALASVANLNTAQVLAALRSLRMSHSISRREYLVPRLHHGRVRTRKTSRLIVEYRLNRMPTFPTFMWAPRP